MSKVSPRDEKRSTLRRQFRRGRILWWLLLILLLAFGLSNLWFNSAWGKDVAVTKLKERTGLEWEIDRVSWSPWNGLNVHGAKALQPEILRGDLDQPLLFVERIRIVPYWRPLLRGGISIREVYVEAPKMYVCVEMLLALGSYEIQQDEVEPLPFAKTEPLAIVKKQAQPEFNNPAPQEGASTGAAPPKKTASKQATVPPLPTQQETRILISGGTIELVSQSQGIELYRASSIDLDLPVFGEDKKGWLKVGETQALGGDPSYDFQQGIVWSEPYLELRGRDVEMGGVRVQYAAQLGMVRGSPFLLEMELKPQELHHVDLLSRFAVDLKAEVIAGRLRVLGSLAQPKSWQSSMILTASNLSMLEKHGGREIQFDELLIPAVFRQGGLIWRSAKIIGEDVSFLSNGKASRRHGVIAVNRVVVSPEIASELRIAMIAAIGSAAIGQSSWWEDLDTPDRKYRDIYLSGPLTGPQVDIGLHHIELPLWQTLGEVLEFIRIEMKEEGVDLPPVPNQSLPERK